MTVITTRLTVGPDGSISAADRLPQGEYAAVITVPEPPRRPAGKPFTMQNFPIHDGPWDDSVSLRREDMYGDDGR
jgi:hypothetical protein